MNYKDQYKHPKWQKVRLKKMESVEKFYNCEVPLCEWCHNDEDQLSVHHIRYFKDRKIWEYSNDELLLLCDSCHSEAHKTGEEIKNLIADLSWCSDSLTAVHKVLLLIKNLGFPGVDYIPDIILSIHSINGNHEVIREYKKIFKHG